MKSRLDSGVPPSSYPALDLAIVTVLFICATVVFLSLHNIDWDSLIVRHEGRVLKLDPELLLMSLQDLQVRVNVLERITVLATLQLFPCVSDLGPLKSLVLEK